MWFKYFVAWGYNKCELLPKFVKISCVWPFLILECFLFLNLFISGSCVIRSCDWSKSITSSLINHKFAFHYFLCTHVHIAAINIDHKYFLIWATEGTNWWSLQFLKGELTPKNNCSYSKNKMNSCLLMYCKSYQHLQEIHKWRILGILASCHAFPIHFGGESWRLMGKNAINLSEQLKLFFGVSSPLSNALALNNTCKKNKTCRPIKFHHLDGNWFSFKCYL